jgi:CheY-like chemotaxis protein
VRGVAEEFRAQAASEGFRYEVAIEPELPEVRLDADAARQVLLNLLSNAVKYSDSQRDIAVRVFRRDAELALQVEDHGIGIEPREQGRIFEEFYRVDAPPPGRRSGVGLGLSLVRRLAEDHGGRVSVAGRSRIPFHGLAPEPRWRHRHGGGREPAEVRDAREILVVEDDRAILDGLRAALGAEGYEVECVQDGRAGLERVRAGAPSLLILDIMLPGMSGFEVAKKLRDEGRALPIILLTARSEEDDRVLGLELGADD